MSIFFVEYKIEISDRVYILSFRVIEMFELPNDVPLSRCHLDGSRCSVI